MQSIKNKAFSLLAQRAYFSKQLTRKLKEKGYPIYEIEPLIEEFQKKGWLNDLELAKRFIERQKQKGYGAKLIAMKLKEKAGDLDLPIEESYESLEALVARRYQKDLPEKREKVIAALMRRGYSYDLIQKVLSSIQGE